MRLDSNFLCYHVICTISEQNVIHIFIHTFPLFKQGMKDVKGKEHQENTTLLYSTLLYSTKTNRIIQSYDENENTHAPNLGSNVRTMPLHGQYHYQVTAITVPYL